MATGKLTKQFRLKTIKQVVNVPAILGQSYSLVSFTPTQLGTGESLVGWSIMGKDGAMQVTILYNNGYYLTCFNAYSQASTPSSVEIYWLVSY